MSNNVKFKVVILGRQGVGKTCLLNRIVNKKFTDKYQTTMTGVFRGKFFSSRGETIQVGIWDTIGTERYKSLNQLFYRGAKAAIVCYDICDARSWQEMKYWISELRLQEETCKIYLCGTKKDLVTEGYKQRDVPVNVTNKHAEGIGSKIVEVSSKTGENVNQLFQMVVDDYMDAQATLENMTIDESIRLSTSEHSISRHFCC